MHPAHRRLCFLAGSGQPPEGTRLCGRGRPWPHKPVSCVITACRGRPRPHKTLFCVGRGQPRPHSLKCTKPGLWGCSRPRHYTNFKFVCPRPTAACRGAQSCVHTVVRMVTAPAPLWHAKLALDMDCGLTIYLLPHVLRGMVRRKGKASGERDAFRQRLPSGKGSPYLECNPSPTLVGLSSPDFPQQVTYGLGSARSQSLTPTYPFCE